MQVVEFALTRGGRFVAALLFGAHVRVVLKVKPDERVVREQRAV